jgi:hypothetical protein
VWSCVVDDVGSKSAELTNDRSAFPGLRPRISKKGDIAPDILANPKRALVRWITLIRTYPAEKSEIR